MNARVAAGNDLELLVQLGHRLNERLPFSPAQHTQQAPWQDMTVRGLLMESLLKVRSKERGLVPLKPNRAQRQYGLRCSRRNIVLKARQLGITTYVAARFFVQTITQPGTMTVQVAHDQESAEEIFKIVHRFWENLSGAMRDGPLQTSRANVRQIVFSRLDSEYRVATAADANAGRGMTIHNLHCSEVASWPGAADETLASLRAAVPDTGEVVLESTPNGAGGLFYEEWQKAEETGYTRHFFPWWFEDAYRVEVGPSVRPLTEEEEQLVAHAGLSDAQIAWRRMKRAQLRGGLAAQEYAEDAVSCFRASGECVFDLETIDRAVRACCKPIEVRDNQRLTRWLPPQPGKQYIIGVDPAGGGSEGDYSCAMVIERTTALQCAELHGHFSPRELASQVIDLGKAYNWALLAVERNNHGYGVLAHLQREGYANLYCEGEQPGWLTSAVTRPAIIENLAAVLTTNPALFNSVRLLNECRTFVRQADGNSRAMAGTHDDCVMAMAIALAARQAATGKHSQKGNVELSSLLINR